MEHKLVIASPDVLNKDKEYITFSEKFLSQKRYNIHSVSYPYLYHKCFNENSLYIRSNIFELLYSDWIGKKLVFEDDFNNFTEQSAFKLFSCYAGQIKHLNQQDTLDYSKQTQNLFKN
ncbi:hypothetical protein RZS08_35300, partial [Arthrospira platensis SPKY1]|nr:hypothetical protein [Arthrospira platensis SPKY1]